MQFDERDMSDPLTKSCTATAGQRLPFCGPLTEVAIAVARSTETADAVLVFDDATGRVVDLDLRGVTSFLSFASNEGYLAGLGHRTAGVEDSRLLPLSEMQPPLSPNGTRS